MKRRSVDKANPLDARVGQVTGTLTGLLHDKGLARNAASLGADRVFSGMVNTEARLLAMSRISVSRISASIDRE